jgi:FKBP-type peptidyl-prolyl cis-trans isomerase FkpA
MSVTAVPIRPIKKGSVTRLWLALILLVAAAGVFAWFGTAGQNWTTTASGLQYRVIEEGTGDRPSANDIALINYEGRLDDGTVFDSNKGQQPAPLPVSGSIPGFAEGLQLMNKGATYALRIPPELGYGAAGAGGVIPPNATLEFEVTLRDFQTLTAEQLQQMQMMQQMQQQMGGAGGPPQGQ